MKALIRAATILSFLLGTMGFSQVINASLSGTVSDPSGALIPGVEVTAKQTETSVVSMTVTNEAGTYRFGSLQPGPYQVAASLPGFQPQTFQVTLGTSQQIRQNFTLQVGGVTQAVEVSVAPDQLLTAQCVLGRQRACTEDRSWTCRWSAAMSLDLATIHARRSRQRRRGYHVCRHHRRRRRQHRHLRWTA